MTNIQKKRFEEYRSVRSNLNDEGMNPQKNAQGRNRTAHTRIFSPLLYQLSYLGKY